MIDIHTHILPHLDDGAKDSTVSLALLQMQQRQGVKTVVFTPHFYGKQYSPEHFLIKRNNAYAHMRKKFPQGMEFRLGAEVHFTGINVLEYADLCSLAIEGTKYLLMELPFTTKWTKDILSKVGEFAYETGYTPIIAHVERYREVRKNPALVNELVDMGCLIQVNADAFLDKKDRSFVFALLSHGLIHCIGSDTHDIKNRPPCMAIAKDAVENAGYGEEWEKIQDIMQDVLADKKVETEYATPVKRFLGKYR